jgi:hypothetical protein
MGNVTAVTKRTHIPQNQKKSQTNLNKYRSSAINGKNLKLGARKSYEKQVRQKQPLQE